MSRIEEFADHLAAEGLPYRQKDENCLVLGFGGEHTSFDALVISRDPDPVVVVVVPQFARVPTARLDESIKLANLLHARILRVGTFYVDHERDLAFQFAVLTPEGVSRKLVRMLVASLFGLDELFPVFGMVLYGNHTADEAMARGPWAEPDEESDDQGLDLAI